MIQNINTKFWHQTLQMVTMKIRYIFQTWYDLCGRTELLFRPNVEDLFWIGDSYSALWAGDDDTWCCDDVIWYWCSDVTWLLGDVTWLLGEDVIVVRAGDSMSGVPWLRPEGKMGSQYFIFYLMTLKLNKNDNGYYNLISKGRHFQIDLIKM